MCSGTPLLKLSANALGVVVWVQKEVRFPGGPDSLWRSQVCSVVAAQQPHGKLLPNLLQARVALLHCCAAAGDTAVPQRSLYTAKAFGCWAHRELQEPNHA